MSHQPHPQPQNQNQTTPNRFNPGNFQLPMIANPTEVHNISAGHPVWKVSMPPNQVVIVKAESLGGRQRDAAMLSATFGVHLMAAVTPGMEAQKLSADETKALWAVDASHFKPQAQDHGAAAKAYLTLVLQTGMAQNIVFKMPFVQNLFALDKAMETHKTVEFAQHLAADDFAATVELGKILAVDLFIGNDDRFDDTGALVNPGNVLLQQDSHQKWHAIGLDHYASAGEHSNLNTPPKQTWFGPKLNTPNQLLNYAGKIMTALNATGTRYNQPALALQPKFQEKLAGGLAQGAAMIRTTVQSAEPSTIPDGVKARFQVLHWDLHGPSSGGAHPQQPQQAQSGSGGRQSPGLPQSTGGRTSPSSVPQQQHQQNPVNVVNSIMSGASSHAPQPVQQSGGGRQSPQQPMQQSGGRQSPNLPQTGQNRQSPNPQPPQQNLRRNSNGK